jgi:DNA-binding PucR family transcriptional regulator
MTWTWYEALAADVDRNLAAYVVAVNERVREQVPDLFADRERSDLAQASSTSLVEAFAEHLHHRLDSRFHAPPPAVAFARHLALASVPLTALLRAYRIGQAALFARAVELITEHDGAGTETAISELAAVMFRLNDEAMVDVSDEFERERQALLHDVITRRVSLVRDLLADQPIDVPSAESTLGYRLDGLHLGLIAWSQQPMSIETSTRLVREVLNILGARDHLIVPRGESELLAWAHVPAMPSFEQVTSARAYLSGPLRMAIGDPAAGPSGFGLTGRQARRARTVVLAKDEIGLACYHSVGLACLLLEDLPAARAFAHTELGSVIGHRELLETLETYLSVGQDQTATATQLGVHRNTVSRRLIQIQGLLPWPIPSRWRQLAAALTITAWIDLDSTPPL